MVLVPVNSFNFLFYSYFSIFFSFIKWNFGKVGTDETDINRVETCKYDYRWAIPEAYILYASGHTST